MRGVPPGQRTGHSAIRMEFGLLGSLSVARDGIQLPITSGKQRAVLAALLVHANNVVTMDELTALVWSRPPPSARVTLQNYVKRLRQVLRAADPARILTRPSGYQVSVGADELDLIVFRRLCAEGQELSASGAWQQAAARWGAALSLWRGRALADIPSEALAAGEGHQLEEMRWHALEARLDANMHLGRHAQVAAEARLLVAAEPLRERLQAALILALYRCGRQADSLATYRQARQLLVRELGIEPGRALQDLNQRILRGDPELDLL
jgi:DNA-binding SARP family transcriptional activator